MALVCKLETTNNITVKYMSHVRVWSIKLTKGLDEIIQINANLAQDTSE